MVYYKNPRILKTHGGEITKKDILISILGVVTFVVLLVFGTGIIPAFLY